MSTDSNLSTDSSAPLLSVITQHLGVVVSGVAFTLVSIRVLGVAKFDVVTALAIVQVGGAGNVAIGSVLASVPTIAAIVVGVMGSSVSMELSSRFSFTRNIWMKLGTYAFAALFVVWWFAVFATIMYGIAFLIFWRMRRRLARRQSELNAISLEAASLEEASQQLKIEVQQLNVRRSQIESELDRLESQDRPDSSEFEQLKSEWQVYRRDASRMMLRADKHNSAAEQLTSRYQEFHKEGWIKSALASIKSKFVRAKSDAHTNAGDQQSESNATQSELQSPQVDPETRGRIEEARRPQWENNQDDSELAQVESEIQERKSEVQQVELEGQRSDSEVAQVKSRVEENKREVEKAGSAFWPTTVYWIIVVIPQVVLTSTLAWLPTEAVVTKKDRAFAAYILSQSDEELVLLRRDNGTIVRLPSTDLTHREICRSSSGFWVKSTIGLAMPEPRYPTCPTGTGSW